jgi:cytochrome c-type biogenesis protein CcmH/NrfG
MLLARGRTADALAAFETVLQKEPNRFNAIAGAAEAAERSGDSAKATRYSQMLVALAGSDASPRPALSAARQRAASVR